MKQLRVLLIGGKIIQDHEFFYPKYRLSEELNISVDVATPECQPCETNKGSKIVPTLAIEEVDISAFDGLVIPGGAHAIEYLRQNKKLIELTQKANELNKVIASICQGSQILISAKCVKGRTVSGYYSIKDDIMNAGGKYLDLPVVQDGNLVCTAHYKDMGPWMKRFIDVLNQNG
jgi:protease I